MTSKACQAAKDHFSLATKQYKAQEWLEAAKSCDKAISLKYRECVVYDVKAAALSKLSGSGDQAWRDAAFEVIKLMIEKFGKNNYKPWFRKAEYFRTLHNYDLALASIETAISKAPSPIPAFLEQKRRQIQGDREIASLQSDRRDARATAAEKKVLRDAKRKAENAFKDFTGLLGPDVVLQIADRVMLDNPSAIVVLAGVRRSWREVLLDRPGMWGNVVLGAKRPVQKLKLFGERSRGRLSKVKIAQNFDKKLDPTLGPELAEFTDDIEVLEIHAYIGNTLREIQKSCKSLTRLSFHSAGGLDYCYPEPGSLDWGVLHRDARLHHLVQEGNSSFVFAVSRHDGQQHIPKPAPRHFEQLKTISLSNTLMYTTNGTPYDLLRATPLVEAVELGNTVWQRTIIPNPSGGQLQNVTLRNLRAYSDVGSLFPPEQSIRFQYMMVPNLLKLDFWKAEPTISMVEQLRAPGLALALANLESLSIGRSTIAQEDILKLLRDMPSLKFLNVSFCGLSDGFLDAITRPDPNAPSLTTQRSGAAGSQRVHASRPNETASQASSTQASNSAQSDSSQADPSAAIDNSPLLPNLIALSIAGSEITSVPLRDFVYSRLPPRARPKPPTSSSSLSATTKRSAFAPTVLASTKRPAPPVPSRATQFQASGSGRGSSSSQAIPSSQQVMLPTLKWLCIDHCESIDLQLPIYLKKKLPFVSHWIGANTVETRIRAQGRYSWEAEWYDSCTEEEENKCFVRLVSGSKDKYEVIHLCRQRNEEPIDPLVNVWATQSSQLDPSTLSQDIKAKGNGYTHNDGIEAGHEGSDDLLATQGDILAQRGWVRHAKPVTSDGLASQRAKAESGSQSRIQAGQSVNDIGSGSVVGSSQAGGVATIKPRKKIKLNPDGSLGGF